MWCTASHILHVACVVCGAAVPQSQGHSWQNNHRVKAQKLPTHPPEPFHVPRKWPLNSLVLSSALSWRTPWEWLHVGVLKLLHFQQERAHLELLHMTWWGLSGAPLCIYFELKWACPGDSVYDTDIKGLILESSARMICI